MNERQMLKDLAEAAMRYDAAIYGYAGSTAAQEEWAKQGYENPFMAGDDDLDKLYSDWLEKARLALEYLSAN